MKSSVLFIDDERPILDTYLKLFEHSSNQLNINSLREKLLNGSSDIQSISLTKEETLSEFESLEFITANQGLDGVKIVEDRIESKSPVAVAFIDMRIPPGINGAETAARIHQIDPSIEIVLVTAYSDTDINKINSQFSRPNKLIYLKKPFDNDEIRQLVRNLYAKKEFERMRDIFTANISHEFKTPISIIKGYSEILMESENLDLDEQSYLSKIRDNSLQLAKYVDELLKSTKKVG